MEAMKKVCRKTGFAVLVLLGMAVLFLAGASAVYHTRLNRAVNALKAAGYYKPVSAGDYSVNVYSCGNENGVHTVIALAGLFDGEMNLGWRAMTAKLEEDNRLVFVDRAGYGLSDDTGQEMTAGNVVNAYRTALQNAGIRSPYVLMAHSMGGVYATYWESLYPDEIEAVIFVDGGICWEIPEAERLDNTGSARLMQVLGKTGLMPLVIRSLYGEFFETLPEEQLQQALYMMCRTMGSAACGSEQILDEQNCTETWRALVPNEIPKLYIAASLGYHTKEDLIADGVPADSLIDYYVERSYKNAGDDVIYEKALEMMEDIRQERFLPYLEKMGNCELIELPGNHLIFLEKPEQCSEIITNFMDGLKDSPEKKG